MTARPPRLLLAIGNPSRGDDALGWQLAERARERFAAPIAAGELEVLSDFQLQVEHALDLDGRDDVVFVDASLDAPAPLSLGPVAEAAAAGAFSHALDPAALLRVVDGLGQARPRRVDVLAIRGERFELGEPLGRDAEAHLEEALRVLEARWGGARERGLRLVVSGVVQGVGFRPFVARTARALGLTGSVRNGPEGVVIELFGGARDLDAFVDALRATPPPGAVVRSWTSAPLAAPAPTGFVIAPSEAASGAGARLSIPPDLALCADCRAEIAAPSTATPTSEGARRVDHAFTSCTACGPRLSIATGLPFDRARTSMATFALCPACAREYADPDDRRYHAQTIACPDCGPTLTLLAPDGAALAGSPLDVAAEHLRAGRIVALQGLGGFHLACDATSSAAVSRLRARKRRDAKPLAVMVADLAAAVALAELTPEARVLLESPAGPIVLADLRADATPALAPDVGVGSPRVGVLLPTTPLHARLLARLPGGGPLVMTSGNVSGEPIAVTRAEALATLGPIADVLLVHDRAIVRRVEDSVVACDRHLPPRVVRRARGYAPRPIRLPIAAPEPILAVGGHMKAVAAVVLGDECWLTPHLGDLEGHAAERAWVQDVEGFERLLGARCDLLVHDAHPDYTTTRYAEARARRRLAVQHHHAHVLAVLAERRALEPVLAIVFDGTGFGPDGTAWGGEILRVDGDGLGFSRPTALRPLPLPGGERAVHEVWRAAYGALFDTFGPEAQDVARRLPGFPAPRETLPAIDTMLTRGVGVVHARGVGRVFDAAAALVLGRATASYEGELPMHLEALARPGAAPYAFAVPSAVGPVSSAAAPATHALTPAQEIDLRPMWRALVDDLRAGVGAPAIASRLHATVVAATLATIEAHQLAAGVRRVVLSGGAFQNRLLERAFRAALGDVVLDPIEVPVHDGGLALGQALAGVLHLLYRGG